MTRRRHMRNRGGAIGGGAHVRLALGALVTTLVWAVAGTVPAHSVMQRGHEAIRVAGAATRLSAAPALDTVDFVDARYGWAAGDAILATTDGGRTWRRQVNPVGPIALLDFVNRDDGWALGHTAGGQATGTILRTAVGGRHWHVVPEPRIGGRPYTLMRLHFASPTLGAGVAVPGPNAYYGGPGSRGRALLTVDGGLTWQTLPTPTDVSSLCFVDPTTGWAIAAGTGILLHTTDGGRSWRRSLPDGANGATFFIMGGELACPSASTAWALLYGPGGMMQQTYALYYALYYTADAGIHWRAVAGRLSIGGDPPPGTPGIPVKALHLHDDAPGMYGGPLAAVDQTTAYLGGSNAATDLIAVGGTSDGGRTWHNEPAIGGLHLSGVDGFPGFALSFVSAQQGWLVASTPPPPRQVRQHAGKESSCSRVMVAASGVNSTPGCRASFIASRDI